MDIPNREEFLDGCKEFKKREKRDSIYKVTTFLVDHYWGKFADMADGLGVLLLIWNQAFYRYGIFDFEKLEKCINDNFKKIETFKNKDISNLSSSDENDIKELFAKFLEALQIDSMKFSDKNTKRYTKKHLDELLQKWKIKYTAVNLKTIYESIKDNPKIKDAIEFIRSDETNPKKESIQITISKLADAERSSLESTKLVMKSPVAVAKALHVLAPNFFPLWDDKIARKYECYYNENPAEKYLSFCKRMKTMVDVARQYLGNSDETLKRIDEYNYSKYTQRWI